MSNDKLKQAEDHIAGLVLANPERATEVLREIWKGHLVAFGNRGVPGDPLARSILDMAIRAGCDVWGPAATAVALRETADRIADFPDLNSPSGKH